MKVASGNQRPRLPGLHSSKEISHAADSAKASQEEEAGEEEAEEQEETKKMSRMERMKNKLSSAAQAIEDKSKSAAARMNDKVRLVDLGVKASHAPRVSTKPLAATWVLCV